MRNLNAVDWIALVLLIIGGLNWGLIGFFNYDLIGALFGPLSVVSRIIYALVGISALYEIVIAPSLSRRWSAGGRIASAT